MNNATHTQSKTDAKTNSINHQHQPNQRKKRERGEPSPESHEWSTQARDNKKKAHREPKQRDLKVPPVRVEHKPTTATVETNTVNRVVVDACENSNSRTSPRKRFKSEPPRTVIPPVSKNNDSSKDVLPSKATPTTETDTTTQEQHADTPVDQPTLENEIHKTAEEQKQQQHKISGIVLKNNTAVPAPSSPRKNRKRKEYICRKCQLPSKGHICPFKERKPPKKLPASKKGAYKCSACGNPLKGHVCLAIGAPTAATATAAATTNATTASQDREWNTRPDATEDAIDCGAPTIQYTHIMAPAHLLTDTVHDYLQSAKATRKITPAVHEFVLQWTQQVHRKFQRLDEQAMEAIQIAREQHQVDKRLQRQRDGNLTLRTKIRSLDFQIENLQRKIVQQQHENRTQQQATQLLDTLDQLRSAQRERLK